MRCCVCQLGTLTCPLRRLLLAVRRARISHVLQTRVVPERMKPSAQKYPSTTTQSPPCLATAPGRTSSVCMP